MHLLEKQVQFGWVGGVSAGASHTVNFLSGDKERARSSFTDFANNPSFGGLSHFLRGRGYFNAEFIYEKAADKDLPFDWKTFTESSAQVCISATRADTGETVNWGRQDMPSLPDLMMRVRASSTLPLIMPMRLIDDVPFVDGALGIPVASSLTRPKRLVLARFFSWRRNPAIMCAQPRSVRAFCVEHFLNTQPWQKP